VVLRYKEIIKKLDSKYLAHSCIEKKDTFLEIMLSIKPKPIVIVEIGTYFGVSTVILASICDVYTFDVHYYKETKYVWNKLKSQKNIYPYIVTNSSATKLLLRDKKFDFAFIDSVHDYENAKIDFEVVKKCGRVLFHDNNDKFPGVAKFCREIGCKKIEDFGYWEDKDNA